jgi:hypothetical protein
MWNRFDYITSWSPVALPYTIAETFNSPQDLDSGCDGASATTDLVSGIARVGSV